MAVSPEASGHGAGPKFSPSGAQISVVSFLFRLKPRPRFPVAATSFADSQTLSGSNDASSGNGEGSSWPDAHHIRRSFAARTCAELALFPV